MSLFRRKKKVKAGKVLLETKKTGPATQTHPKPPVKKANADVGLPEWLHQWKPKW